MINEKRAFRINLLLMPDPMIDKISPYIQLFYYYLNKYTKFINLVHYKPYIGENIEFLRLFNLFFSAFRSHIIHINWPDIILGISKSKIKLRNILFRFVYWFIFTEITKLRGGKIVITHHNILPHKCLPFECHLKSLELKMMQILLKKSNLIIVLNNFSKEFLCNIYDSEICRKTVVITHPHYNNYYGKSIDKETARKKLNIPLNKFVVLIIGTISKYKNPDFIIQTIKYTCKESAKGKILFLIVGKQKEEFIKMINKLRADLNEANECIYIVNKYVPENELRFYLSAGDLALLTYKWIWGTATLNLYISYRVPILFVPLPPLREELGNALYKHLYVNDPIDASRKILFLAKNNKVYKKIKEISDKEVSKILKRKDPRYIILKHILIYYELYSED